MTAPSGATRDETPSGAGPTYVLTFGDYDQTGPWTDARELDWSALAALLTRHAIGRKEGACVVPATFSGTKRRKADAVRIDVAMLDSDAGATLHEITAAITARGWVAAVASTHSHLSTRTRAKRGHWDAFRAKADADGPGAAEAFLVREKGCLQRVAIDARVVEETAEHAVFGHAPCPKFRVAIPVLRPWSAAAYADWRAAGAAWKERIGALAAALGLRHDQACTDTSRLFYLPRRPLDGPPAETAVLDGDLCDLFALPRAARSDGQRSGGARRAKRRAGTGGDDLAYTDPDAGEVLDLRAWARGFAARFEIAEALRARSPGLLLGKALDGGRQHVRCANEDAHTQAGEDRATFVVDASESGNGGGFVHHCRHAHCDGRDRLFFLRRMLEQRWLRPADLEDPRFLSGEGAQRPRIRFVAGKLPAVVAEAEQALLRAGLGLYQRGTFLVRPGRVTATVSRERRTSALRILEVEEHALAEAMTEAAAWEKYDGRSRAWVAIDAPLKAATTYRQRVGRWRLPVLSAIVSGPTLRADGSILARPGYDPSTGLLFDLCGERFPPIPDRPDREVGRAALSVLLALVETFPFVGEADRAVALSGILTGCVRRSLRTAPLHAFTAPAAGSGKSMLVDLGSVIATGREAGVIAQGRTEEEFEKRLGALLLAGDQVVAVDNCEAPLGGEFLCQMLTQPIVRARILGRSEAPELPANACVTATGNNLTLIGDLTRRAVLCRLDAGQERPELRRFPSNPVQVARADRGRYLAAALTALRAYHVAGRPQQPDALGSFEEWSGWVRGALIWLGQADPVATMVEARELDPKLDALVAVTAQWSTVIGGGTVSVRDVIDHATKQRILRGAPQGMAAQPGYAHADFREALLTVAGEGGAVNSRRLGKWLASNQDRIVHGRRLVRQGLSGGILQWRLEQAGEGDAHATP